jgi:hypothetical protein
VLMNTLIEKLVGPTRRSEETTPPHQGHNDAQGNDNNPVFLCF